MLQPRKRKFTLEITPKGLLLCVIILLTFTPNLNCVKGEDEINEPINAKIRRGERVIRHGDINIVVLDDLERRKLIPSLGLLSTTARTFIQEGTTTEYSTHIYGTTLGDKYAHIVSTGSKIFYDNIRPPKEKTVDPIITIPSLDSLIFPEDNAITPSKVARIEQQSSSEKSGATNEKSTSKKEETYNKNVKSLKPDVLSISESTPVTLNSLPRNNDDNDDRIFANNLVSIKKEISIKPAKVKIKNDLPTFTVKQDGEYKISNVNQNIAFEVENRSQRLAKQFVPDAADVTTELITTTYYGFADYVTTAGNTVIIFTPKTKKPNIGTVTSILGEATLSTASTVQNTAVHSTAAVTTLDTPVTVVEQKEPKDDVTEPTEKEYETTTAEELTSEYTTEPTIETTENVDTTTDADDLVKNKDVPLLEDNLESSFTSDIFPTPTTDVYKTVTFVTSFFLPKESGQISTSVQSETIVLSQTTETKSIKESTTEVLTTPITTTEIEETTTEANDNETTTSHEETTDATEKDVISTTPAPPPKEEEEEVELVFKTLYTTYTYLTTFFEKHTTKVKSREEVVTNVVTSTLDSAFWQLATDPAVAGLFLDSVPESQPREGKLFPSTVGVGRPTTMYHENEIDESEFHKPTPILDDVKPAKGKKTLYTTYTSFSKVINDDKTTVLNKTEIYSNIVKSADSSVYVSQSTKFSSELGNSTRKPYKSVIVKHTPALAYKTTIKRIKPTNTKLNDNVRNTKIENDSSLTETSNEKHDPIVMDAMSLNSVIISAPELLGNDISFGTRKSTEQTPKKVFLDNDAEDDQLSEESNTKETIPNPSLISLQTSYTTYTYFTTVYKGTTSDIVSRLETVTNINTELVKPTSTDIGFATEETAPVTYYTTYTYWTTFYKDGSTMIQSRQETVSNIVTPTPTLEPKSKTIVPTQIESFTEPVTYYTTFTYFTTSYIDNASVVNSHLETVTNIVEPTKIPESKTDTIVAPIFKPINTETNNDAKVNNATTVLATNMLENSSEILPNVIASSKPSADHSKPTGIVSVNEGKIVDAFGISTTFYTTKAIGTYIEQLYAQVIESTSSIQVNAENQTNLANPSTVVLNNKIYQTGLLQLTEGSIVEGKTTTFYETKILGSIINDHYSSITETSTNVYVNILPTKIADTIKSTATIDLPSGASSSSTTLSPTSTVIEGSLNEVAAINEQDDDDENNKLQSRRKSFTPVIRPFASRSRPTFLPKKKTAEPLSAATITRALTPTIVATPALKTNEPRVFGSANRNRFASNRKSSPSNSPYFENKLATASTGRRFSRPKTNSTSSLQQFGKSTSSVKINPSAASSLPAYKRGSYRPTSSKPVSDTGPTIGSRFRIRPSTTSSRFTSTTTPRLEEESGDSLTEQAQSSSDDEVFETLPPATTESSRRGNPLLRFRKPSVSRSTTLATTTTKTASTKKNFGLRKTNDNRIATTKATTTTKSPRNKTPSSISSRARSKQTNSLLPQRDVLKKSETNIDDIQQELDTTEQQQGESVEEITEISEPSYANAATGKTTRNGRNYNAVSIKPFPNRRGRAKRQAEFGYKYESVRQKNRNRRPSTNTFPDYLYYDDTEYTTEDISARSVGNRNTYKSRNNQSPQQYQQQMYQQPFQQYQQIYQTTAVPQTFQQSLKIRPSPVASSTRSPFTIREKTTTTAPRSNRRTTAAPIRKNYNSDGNYVSKRPSRLRSYTTTTTTTEAYRNSRKQTSSRRTNNRLRYKDNDYNTNTQQPYFDGTITVTHKIPTEVTIPIVSGKVTEYKNVLTAKPSIQILAPHQYSTVMGKNGATTLQFVNEVTETLSNGVTEVTRYIIQEFPTTSIAFTPTTIRGRKTSFSHVVPSTVYEIKPEVSTITPQLNANAPLANLLLSQLLLGNLGIQPTINPLLGINQASTTPVTEFKIKTTTYVTTITHSTSTVIPVTFRGKEIKTTVIDSSTQVITATEHITETVVISPTPTPAGPNQLNTLLLPALLQAQLLSQSQTKPTDESVADNLQDISSPSKMSKNGLLLEQIEDEYARKDSQRKKQKKPFDSPIEPAETSVVTLYLSGRKPGEFSTVLSTVTLDDKSATLRKRNVDSVAFDVKPSEMPSLDDPFRNSNEDYIDTVVKSGINDVSLSSSSSSHTEETQSLESIIADISDHFTKNANELNPTEVEKSSNHFLLKTSTENAPFRWNSINVVNRSKPRSRRDVTNVTGGDRFPNKSDTTEWSTKMFTSKKSPVPPFHPVIKRIRYNRNQPNNVTNYTIDGDKSASNERNDSLTAEDEWRGRYNLATKVMSNGVEVIIALDKSTLPGSPQLLRVLPTSNIRPITLTASTVTDHMIMMLPHGLQEDVQNPFITKTYLTTYTYITTLLEDGETATSSKEKIVTNVLTENLNSATSTIDEPTGDAHVSLSSSPIMATKVFETTYNMESTINRGNTPHIVISQQTVANTVTAPGDFMHLLQPSEVTYGDINSMPSKETQYEDFTIKPTEELNTEKTSDQNQPIDVKPTSLQATDITKTYFITYTYYSTLLENGSTVVKSNVATSSDVVTEKLYTPLKRTKNPSYAVKETASFVSVPDSYVEKPINIFATKTYLTTFTYFTTLLQDKGGKSPQTVIRSRTKVMQNLVTETIKTDALNPDYLSVFKNSLKKDPLPITATATLTDGQKLEITAMNENSPKPNIDRISSSLEENQEYYNQITNHLENAENYQSIKNEHQMKNLTKFKTSSFSTAILQSKTIVKNGATLLPGSQIIKFTDSAGNISIIPVSDPVSKHPDGLYHKPEINKIQMNDLLTIGSLGINGFNALKPVINAMAGLWQNNAKNNVRDKNDTKPYQNELIELNTNLKPPSRTPIYIPVGTLQNDNEEAESEDLPEQYPDVNQRNNHVVLNKAPMEKPLVSGGGIPISPGQVITANTDVIVGTPAVHGPRPPIKNSNEKSDIPIGMRPPPLPSSFPNYSSEEVNNIPYPFADVIKLPPKHQLPAFLNSEYPQHTNIKYSSKNHHKQDIDQKISLPSEIKLLHIPLRTPLVPLPDNINEISGLVPPRPPLLSANDINSSKETSGLTPPRVTRFPAADSSNEASGLIPAATLNHHVFIEHSSLNPLLVNIRPSQVAQVVIPHGSQTTLIYSDHPVPPTKGEIFNDPSPYPEENINPGFIDLQVYGPSNSEHVESSSKISSNTIHVDIPINPYSADGAITESHHFIILKPDGNVQNPYKMGSALKAPTSEDPFKRPTSKYNFTITRNEGAKPTHPYVWSQPSSLTDVIEYDYETNHKHVDSHVSPQNKPNYIPSLNDSIDGGQNDSEDANVVNEADDNDDDDDDGVETDDELTQETKLKPNNQLSNLSNTVLKMDDSIEQYSDFEINQNWEIMREKITTKPSKEPNKTEIKYQVLGDNNSTTRKHPNIKYSDWSGVDFPLFSNEINPVNENDPSPALDSIANLEKVNVSKAKPENTNAKKPSLPNQNIQNDVVIGLSPPPPPRPSISPPKSRPSIKPPFIRPSIKNKPKPAQPYQFEKPSALSPIARPKPTLISKPNDNVLYETDPPNFSEELLKMKPLNSTGKIEPVKKWQMSKPVFGNVIKVQYSEKTHDSNNRNNSSLTDTLDAQSDTKIIVVEKLNRETSDRTTELISKWNEHGIISSSKNDFDDVEYKHTPTMDTNRTKSNSAPNTIFGNLYTRPPPANIIIIPTHSTTQHYTAISMVIDQPEKERTPNTYHDTKTNLITPTPTFVNNDQTKDEIATKNDQIVLKTSTPTYYITHTKTLSVTITQTTVIHRDGQPSTHTIVLTKTQTSTLIDTVTKIQTLLQPTSVLSTITTTIPVTVSKEPTYSTATPTDLYAATVSVENHNARPAEETDSVFVIMTDKKSGSAHIGPTPTESRPTGFEVQVPNEANEISPNDILYSGIFTQQSDNECRPECKVAKNEICQKIDSTMRCVCRPGFGRMFPDHPCKPTYTYVMRLPLDRQGVDEIRFTDGLADRTSPSHQQLTEAAKDGLDRMVMQSGLRDIYHGIIVSGFEPTKKSDKAAVVYMVQLSENAEETKLQEEVHKTLKANNYSLGGTDVFASPDMFHFIHAEDFDECNDSKYHDCSENAQCFNLRGTYTCSCKEGFTDISYNIQFPGRLCSADTIGCELCNYHGTCYYKADEDPTCECFPWYAGEFCQINLKVTLISLIVIGVLLSVLLVVCVVMTCNKQKQPEILRAAPKTHAGFRRYRSVTNIPGDKRAIVNVDTSSEDSIERTSPPFNKQRVLRNEVQAAPSNHGAGGGTVQSTEQRDRSLTVLIPRAKYRPVPSQPSSTLLTMSTFGPEQKLLNYAASRENSRTPEKKVSRCSMHSRRLSNSTNLSAEPLPKKKISTPRRPSSGALVSAGFEVSATVRRTQELDEAYISQSHNDLNQPTYNSIRTAESSVIVDDLLLPVFESSLQDFITRVDKLGTVSEARSYDETTIQPPVRSLHHIFHSRGYTCDSKHSSSQKTNLDEHHTMGERDLGSTYMPKSQLYKPDHRESDGSNFDSL